MKAMSGDYCFPLTLQLYCIREVLKRCYLFPSGSYCFHVTVCYEVYEEFMVVCGQEKISK